MENNELKNIIMIIMVLFLVIYIIISLPEYELLREYNLLKPNKFINLTGCDTFELWIRFNESGVCLQGLPHENLSQIDSIQNYCNQDILVKCG